MLGTAYLLLVISLALLNAVSFLASLAHLSEGNEEASGRWMKTAYVSLALGIMVVLWCPKPPY